MARASDSASGPALGKSARVPPATGSGLVPAKSADRQRAVERPSRPRFRMGRVSRLWATAMQFLTEVRAEMTRVAWPDRQTVIASTIVVLFVLTVTAIYLAGWDWIFGELFSYLFKR
jgi:preprotein translocase subunit SecE